jgi:(1->4)-alpha-D-glucan 1-alpha-D-glucosylmutase
MLDVAIQALLDDWPDGRIKFFVTIAALRLRREWSDVFLDGTYTPLSVETQQGSVVAFHRADRGRHVLVAVPLFVAAEPDVWPLGESFWRDDRVALPSDVPAATWRHVYTGATVHACVVDGVATVRAADLFRTIPVAILRAEVTP